MNFKNLNLSSELTYAVAKMGYETVTPIQELAIPKILDGKDIIGLAQTGTGKTAAFALPMLDLLLRSGKNVRNIKTLILTPTRELATQIRDNIIMYANNTNYKCSVIIGGVKQSTQINMLKKGVDILVATPGRLVDLINQNKVFLNNVSMLILDEADTMLDMGFIRDIKTIISKVPTKRQTLLFSATMPNEIKELSKTIMNDPVTIKTQTTEVTADNITQEVYYVDKKNKNALLLDILAAKEQPTALVFTRTKHGANNLEKTLREYNIHASVIHGGKTQSNRVKALQDFKSGKHKVMVATDIAARGIDINNLALVINYDIPEQAELYVHRIGRTARAGKSGKAISFCSSAEKNDLKCIEKLIHHNIPVMENDKYPMVLNEKKPIPGMRGKQNNNNLGNKNNNNSFKPKSFDHRNFKNKGNRRNNYK